MLASHSSTSSADAESSLHVTAGSEGWRHFGSEVHASSVPNIQRNNDVLDRFSVESSSSGGEVSEDSRLFVFLSGR